MFGFVTPIRLCAFSFNKVPLAHCINKTTIWDAKIAKQIVHYNEHITGGLQHFLLCSTDLRISNCCYGVAHNSSALSCSDEGSVGIRHLHNSQ